MNPARLLALGGYGPLGACESIMRFQVRVWHASESARRTHSRASLLPRPVTDASAASRVTSSALFTIGWAFVRFVRAVTILSRCVKLIRSLLVPAKRLIAPARIAFNTNGCFVFSDVLPASILDSCNVNTSRSPASADLALVALFAGIAVVKVRVFQG